MLVVVWTHDVTDFTCTTKAVDDIAPGLEAEMNRAVEDSMADMTRAHEMVETDPRLPFITALVMAGDARSAERSKRWVEDGTHPFDQAINYVGSYARFEFALWGIEHGHTTQEALFADLPDLWRGSDPDDTDPRALALWKAAHAANKGRYIRDGRPLPRGRTIRVYRGQDDGAPFGIAWTTDLAIAEKFARGAATRQDNRGGRVFEVNVPRDQVIAYITGRNESEVILDTVG